MPQPLLTESAPSDATRARSFHFGPRAVPLKNRLRDETSDLPSSTTVLCVELFIGDAERPTRSRPPNEAEKPVKLTNKTVVASIRRR